MFRPWSVLTAAVLLASCTTVPVQREGIEPPADAKAGAGSELAVVAGRIDPEDATNVEGSKISVFLIQDNGKLERISVESTMSDQNGRFQVPVRIPVEPKDLLVVADNPKLQGQGTVIVPSWSAVDSVIVAPPISLETGVESDVYLAAVNAGIWIPHLGAADLRGLITDRLAAKLRTSPTYEEDVLMMARALLAAIESWYRVLLHPDVGLDTDRVQTVLEALAWAQVAFDAQLYSAENLNESEDARMIHEVAVRASYAGVGVGPEHLAIAAQASADAMRRFALVMSPESRPIVMAEAEALRAKYVTTAIESLFVRAGASESEREAVKTAGVRLEGKILSAPNAVDDVDGFLKNAWSEYRKAVQGRLRHISGTDEAEEEVI